MNDIFISSKEIEKELKEIEDEGVSLKRNLALLTQKITYIFSKIKSCEEIEFAEFYFDVLGKIQAVLAKLLFGEGIGVPERLQRFVKDFDNLEIDREYYFKKIKSGEYHF